MNKILMSTKRVDELQDSKRLGFPTVYSACVKSESTYKAPSAYGQY
jgi:hypothetical protein